MYKQQLEAKELSLRGWNWGKTEFQGKNLSLGLCPMSQSSITHTRFFFPGPNLIFNVGNKEMFELPLSQAIGANKPGKNEVTINFVDPGQKGPEGMDPKQMDELMDMTFYIPGTVPKEENADENTEEDDAEEVNADAVSYCFIFCRILGTSITEPDSHSFYYRSFTRMSSPNWNLANLPARILYNSKRLFALLLGM
jgi:structure-specific recognition protein 1